MKQTAVEWLKEQYDSCPNYEKFLGEDDWEQAKAMEKEYLYNFYMQGGVDVITVEDRNVEQYYNETFKSE